MFTLILGLWQFAGITISPLLISPPTAIVSTMIQMYPQLAINLQVTLSEMLFGFMLAVSWGLTVGYLLSLSRFIELVVDPFMLAFYSVPIIAIAPLLILIFGFGPLSKVATAAIYAGFPVFINTVTGIKNVDETYLIVGRSFGLKEASLFSKIKLPASVPYLIAGIRLCATFSLVGVITSEFLAARAGLGWLIEYAVGTFQTPVVYAGLVILSVVGVTINEVIRRIEYRFARWHYSSMRQPDGKMMR